METTQAINRVVEVVRDGCCAFLSGLQPLAIRPAANTNSERIGPAARVSVSGSHMAGEVVIAASEELIAATNDMPDMIHDWVCELTNQTLARIRESALREQIDLHFGVPVLGTHRQLGGIPTGLNERIIAVEHGTLRMCVWLHLEPHERPRSIRPIGPLGPSLRPPAPPNLSAPPVTVQSRTDKRTAIVVDDSGVIRKCIRIALEKSGFQVADYPNGMAALRHLDQEGCADLLVTDFRMPAIDGLQLTQRIREDARFDHMMVLMVTAETTPASEMGEPHLRPDEVMLKPFDQVMFEQALKRMQARHRG